LTTIIESSAICLRNRRRHLTFLLPKRVRPSGCRSSVRRDISTSDECPALRHIT
jgi:hypothetical protein